MLQKGIFEQTVLRQAGLCRLWAGSLCEKVLCEQLNASGQISAAGLGCLLPL